MTFTWRQMTAADLDAVERIAGRVHPRFFERREVLAEKQRLHPAGSWLCEHNASACGYLLTHPWHERAIPALDTLLKSLPQTGNYYLHDLALLPEARGVGAAGTIVGLALAQAREGGFTSASLVAVNGSLPFWQKHGFAALEDAGLDDKLAAYEPGARYMTRLL